MKNRQFYRYLISGFATTCVNWVVYTLLQAVPGLYLTLVNAIAWLVATCFSFFINKEFVFHSHSHKPKLMLSEGLRFLFSRAISGVFDIFLPTGLMLLGLNQSFLSIRGFWAKLATGGVVLTINYLMSKMFVFKKK